MEGRAARALTPGEAGSRGAESAGLAVLGAVSSECRYYQVGSALVSSKMTTDSLTSVPSC